MAIVQHADVFRTAWRSYIYDRFSNVTYRKEVFKRRRALALAMPLGRRLATEELPILTTELARLYGRRTERTLQRDVEILIEMELVAQEAGLFSPNAAALELSLPQRRRKSSSAT